MVSTLVLSMLCILKQDVEGANQEWAALQKAALPFERILEVGASRVEVLASAGEPHCSSVGWCWMSSVSELLVHGAVCQNLLNSLPHIFDLRAGQSLGAQGVLGLASQLML